MLFRAIKQKLILLFVPRIIWLLTWFIFLSSKKLVKMPCDKLATNNYIFAFWHGETLFQPFTFLLMKPHLTKARKENFYFITSKHFDGDIVDKYCSYFGLKAIRGSSSKGGNLALKESLDILDSTLNVAITPDGPRGPFHSVANGVVILSIKSGRAIMPIRVRFSKYWQLKTWDRMQIPKPFGRIEIILGHDFYARDFVQNIDSKNLDLSVAKEAFKSRMQELFKTPSNELWQPKSQ